MVLQSHHVKSLWQENVRLQLLRRIESVQPGTRPLWGKMSAPRMIRHLSQSLAMASGELPVAGKKVPIRYFPIKQLFVYVLPLPKGLPTAPELLEGDGESIDSARADLSRNLDAFVARGERVLQPDHPVFGKMTANLWGVLMYRHADHHLRQFGV
jgi:hypothetical protein